MVTILKSFFYFLLTAFLPYAGLSMELKEYQTELRNVIKTIESTEAEDCAKEIALVKAKISSWDAVLLEGITIETDHSWLVSDLETVAQEEDFKKKEKALKGILGKLKSLEYALEVPELTLKDPKILLAKILARKEFAGGNNFFITFFNRIAQWLTNLIKKLIPDNISMKLSPRFVEFLKWFFYSALGAGFIILTILIIRKIVAGVSVSIAPTPGEPVRTEYSKLESSQELRKKGEDFARGGDYRSAVRYLYLSILVYLDEKGRIEYDRTETNSEYLGKISQESSFYEALKFLVPIFERCWYGLLSPGNKEYAQFQECYQSVLVESKV